MIETARLTLRRARISDLEPLHQIMSDPRAMRYWDRPAFDDIALTETFLRGLMDDVAGQMEFIVVCDGQCIGKAGLWREYEIGYILHPDYWNRGYGFEALTALVAEIRAQRPNLPHLTAEIDPRNLASHRLLDKLGFVHLRTEERNFLYGGTEWCDTAYFKLDFQTTDG